MTKYFYIYNLKQSNFFIEMGVPVLSVGKGSQGEFFVKFPRNEESEKVFTIWVERGKPK